jgi:hypothetical protein
VLSNEENEKLKKKKKEDRKLKNKLMQEYISPKSKDMS